MKVGIGYDIHALVKGRLLILGGIRIPYPKGLKGHSDGDVLLHAVTDAILGACGGGDIGELFPDTDRRTRGADSAIFLQKANEILRSKRFRINNVDAVVIAEAPKLSVFKDAMRRNIAKILSLTASQVNVKAKTNEGFGPVGKKQAIACTTVVLIEKIRKR